MGRTSVPVKAPALVVRHPGAAPVHLVCLVPGVVWTSRLGHTYQIYPEPIIELLPDPLPRDREPWPLITPGDEDWEDDQILDDSQPGPDPPRPAPPHDPDKDPPPF